MLIRCVHLRLLLSLTPRYGWWDTVSTLSVPMQCVWIIGFFIFVVTSRVLHFCLAWTEFSKRLCDHSFCTYYVRSMCMFVVICMYVVICKIDHCIHKHWCIPMGLGHNDPFVESHMWPQQTWGQRSSRGQWPLVQVFGKKDQCIHILWCIFKSNITMIAKVCDRESRRDSWIENRPVVF